MGKKGRSVRTSNVKRYLVCKRWTMAQAIHRLQQLPLVHLVTGYRSIHSKRIYKLLMLVFSAMMDAKEQKEDYGWTIKWKSRKS